MISESEVYLHLHLHFLWNWRETIKGKEPKYFVVQQALDLNGQFFSIYSWIIFGLTVYFLVLVITLFLKSWLFTYSRFLYFFANLSLFLCICNVLHFLCHSFVKFCHSICWLDDWTKDIFPSKMSLFLAQLELIVYIHILYCLWLLLTIIFMDKAQ